MFVTARDPPRRRSRSYGGNKAARSSKLSLLSAFTASSSGSGGSNSTITQESYTRSRATYGRSGRRRRTNKVSKLKDVALASNPKASVDVFDFLVEDETSKTTITEPVEEEDALEDQSDPECFYRSHMSDSGISMGDSSLDGREVPKWHLHTLSEEPHYGPIILQPPPELPYPDRRWSWTGAPVGPIPMEGFFPPHIVYEPPMEPPHMWGVAESTAIGTPSTAPDLPPGTKISVNGEGQPPRRVAFRSFAKITLRLLLQMQDEIAELEEELLVMDSKAEEQTDSSHETSSARGYDLQRRRVDIYQDLHLKLKQYQRVLFDYNKSQTISEPADRPTLSAYKKWLEEHVSPPSRLPYLQGKDLRYFTFSSKQTPTALESQLLPVVLISSLCEGLLPLLMFKIFHGVLNRLIILTCFTAACAMILDKAGIRVGREHAFCVMAFSFISLCAALLL